MRSTWIKRPIQPDRPQDTSKWAAAFPLERQEFFWQETAAISAHNQSLNNSNAYTCLGERQVKLPITGFGSWSCSVWSFCNFFSWHAKIKQSYRLFPLIYAAVGLNLPHRLLQLHVKMELLPNMAQLWQSDVNSMSCPPLHSEPQLRTVNSQAAAATFSLFPERWILCAFHST